MAREDFHLANAPTKVAYGFIGSSYFPLIILGPIRVKRIAKGSAADECGQLQIGDIILEVQYLNFISLPLS